MSYSKRQDGGGDTELRTSSTTSNPSCTIPGIALCPPPITLNLSTITTVATILNLTTIATSTLSSNFISTLTTTSLPVTAITSSPNSTISSALAAENSLLKSNARLAERNFVITTALGGFIVLLLIGMAVFLCLRLKRRNHKKHDSPPFTSMDMRPSRPVVPSIRSGIAGPFVTQEPRPVTALSTGPGGQGHGAVALKSYPVPNSRAPIAKRSSSAPNLNPPPPLPPPPHIPTDGGLPTINILPNTPSMRARNSSPSPIGPVGPQIQQGAGRRPEYHETLRQQAELARSGMERENSGRLGLPVVERSERWSQRASVSTIGSDLSRFALVSGNGGNTPSRQGMLHSTRASSGVFPEGHENDDEESDDAGRGKKGTQAKRREE